MLRVLAAGVPDGPDVAVLEANLASLGFAPGPVDQDFDAATTAAVRRWQASLHLPQDGVVRLGDVFTEPTDVRVVSVPATIGGPATPGATVLTATSTTPAVTVPLPAAKQYLVRTGDQVSVDLPDGKTTTSGHITDVSRVATQPTQPGTGSAGPVQSQQQGQQALAAATTVAVTIGLDHPDTVAVLDQAPVQVDITDQTAKGVLAVPVEALLALASDGYGLDLVTPQGKRTVAVQVGLFGGGLVQVSGAGVTEGATVEVPVP